MKKENVISMIAGCLLAAGTVLAFIYKIGYLKRVIMIKDDVIDDLTEDIEEQEQTIAEQCAYIDLLEEEIEENNEIIDDQEAQIAELKKCRRTVKVQRCFKDNPLFKE